MFFCSIDSSGNLGRAFDNCLANNKIYLWKSTERASVLDYYKSIGIVISDDDDIDYCFCSRYPASVINIPLTGKVANDVVSLVHEFLHYYSFGCDTETVRFTYSYLGEMLSIYIETRAANWLVSQGYEEEDAFYMLRFRRKTDAISNLLNSGGLSVIKLIGLLDIKKRDGLITIDNIVKQEEIWTLKGSSYFLEIMETMLDGGKLPVITGEEARILKIEHARDLIGKLSSLFDFSNGYFRSIMTTISYSLGTYFANRINTELDEKMLCIANRLSTTSDESELIALLYNDVQSKPNIKSKQL